MTHSTSTSNGQQPPLTHAQMWERETCTWTPEEAFSFICHDATSDTKAFWGKDSTMYILARIRRDPALWEAALHKAETAGIFGKHLTAYMDQWLDEHPEATPAGTQDALDPPAGEALLPQRLRCPDEAFYGVLGDLAKAVAPYTEADPVAILVQSLLIAGAVIGPKPYHPTGATRHHAHDYVVIVGPTDSGRKGTGLDIAAMAMRPPPAVDERGQPANQEWTFPQIVTGVGSGEGLIYAVRDAIYKQEPVRAPGSKGQKGPIITYEPVMVDAGVSDKRLIIEETEFSRVLKVASREGNTLSELLRQLWETGDLQNTVKGSPYRATGAHGVLIGHITPDELHHLLAKVEVSNGFANRFLWLYSRKQRDLPDGDELDQVDFAPFRKRLGAAFRQVQVLVATNPRMRRNAEARAVWHAVYRLLSASAARVPGIVRGRAAAHVLRLSCHYALLDGTLTITADHLIAALALREYAEASARYLFGKESAEDPAQQKLLTALRQAGTSGLSREAISNVFQRHKGTKAIDDLVQTLCEQGQAEVVTQSTSGRPRQVVRALDCEESEESEESEERGYLARARHALARVRRASTVEPEAAKYLRSMGEECPMDLQDSAAPPLSSQETSQILRQPDAGRIHDNTEGYLLPSLSSLSSQPQSETPAPPPEEERTPGERPASLQGHPLHPDTPIPHVGGNESLVSTAHTPQGKALPPAIPVPSDTTAAAPLAMPGTDAAAVNPPSRRPQTVLLAPKNDCPVCGAHQAIRLLAGNALGCSACQRLVGRINASAAEPEAAALDTDIPF